MIAAMAAEDEKMEGMARGFVPVEMYSGRKLTVMPVKRDAASAAVVDLELGP